MNENPALEIEKPVVSFREVHADLEREASLLNKEHDIKSFTQKGEFLQGIGFEASIATKLYMGIAENLPMIQEMERKYFSQYKFILEPQLERICEKYDLYVRELKYFLGDIPEMNIKHMMDFKINFGDLPQDFKMRVIAMATYYSKYLELSQNAESREKMRKVDMSIMSYRRSEHNDEEYLLMRSLSQYNFDWQDKDALNILATFCSPVGLQQDKWNNWRADNNSNAFDQRKLTLNHISLLDSCINSDRNHQQLPILEIAAVPTLLDSTAFENSRARILTSISEAPARSQVDLDPIVLLKCKNNTRCIITAWGDEANDELVMNPKMN